VNRKDDESWWWVCHSNIYRPSKASAYSLEELKEEGIPPLNLKEAQEDGVFDSKQ
jgi:hypothetical protein